MNVSFIGAGNVAKRLGALIENANYAINFGTRNPTGKELSIQDAIDQSQVIIIAVPYDAVSEIALKYQTPLKGKIIVDATNPINIETWKPYFLGESSAGEKLAALLPDSKNCKSFQ